MEGVTLRLHGSAWLIGKMEKARRGRSCNRLSGDSHTLKCNKFSNKVVEFSYHQNSLCMAQLKREGSLWSCGKKQRLLIAGQSEHKKLSKVRGV